MPLTTGTVLNTRYRIVSLLGQGGFGAVYRAWDLNLNRACAVKENLDTSPEAQKQFGREATLLADLSHPNLVRVIDYFFLPGQGQYFVMDFVEGQDLEQMLQADGPLPVEQVLNWAIQIIAALEYLHTQEPPVIHRDLKPANIKITSKGKAMLVDFGIAKIYDPQLRTTQGARAVTPGFSPPEQYGQGHTDHRTDIYALGATIYTVLTGVVPPDSVDIMTGSAQAPAPAHSLNAQVPLPVSQALAKAMQINRSERFASMAEFGKALNPPEPPVIPPAPVVQLRPILSPPASTPVPVPASYQAPAVPTPLNPPITPPGYMPASIPRRKTPWGWIVAGGVIGLLLLSWAIFPIEPKATVASAEMPVVEPAVVEIITITIWHQWNGDYQLAIQDVLDTYTAAHPDVIIELYRPEELSYALTDAIPHGEGPDIINMSNDQIGTQAMAGNIIDLDSLGISRDELNSTFEPAGAQGVVWQDRIWALPQDQEGIAIIYNKALARPNDFANEPLDLWELLRRAGYYFDNTGRYLVCNSGFGNADAFMTAPIWFTFGMPGYVDDQGNVYINTPEGREAAEWMIQFHKYAPAETNYDICRNMFLEGQAAAWWNGPWAIADLEAAGINYGILPMGRPFVGLRTWMITKNALERGSAEIALDIIRFITNIENSISITLTTQTIPANTVALNSEAVQGLENVAGFGRALNLGVPMANTPFSGAQWGPVGDATAAIWFGYQTPEDALSAAQAAMEEAIATMR